MLPATFCAGMTLPLLTRTLLGRGLGERAIGAVYGWNTLGSIVGVVVGGLVLLPLLGLKGMLLAGAGLDMAIGLVLLSRGARRTDGGRRPALAAAAGAVVVLAWAGLGIRLDRDLMISGVYRLGKMPLPGALETKFYRDGRTATVSVVRGRSRRPALSRDQRQDRRLARTRNGSGAAIRRLARLALGNDAATQTLLPLVTLAHAPAARSAAIIGYGSGMSSHLLLGSPRLQQLVTIEIEPKMVEGARTFYPANRRVYDDPRSTIVLDDAKSYFASEHRRFDLILSEPSNPWVSGVSGLFTTEFYARIGRYLTDDGVFGQWIHTYELDDALVTSVLAGIHRNFRDVRRLPRGGGRSAHRRDQPARVAAAGLVGDGVARGAEGPLPLPSAHRRCARQSPPGRPAGARAAAGRLRATQFRLLPSARSRGRAAPVPARLRRRVRRAVGGVAQLPRLDRWAAHAAGRRPDRAPARDAEGRARAVDAYLRGVPAAAGTGPAVDSWMREASFSLQQWQTSLAANRAPADWELWTQDKAVVDRYHDGATAGVMDEARYAEAVRFLEQHHAPAAGARPAGLPARHPGVEFRGSRGGRGPPAAGGDGAAPLDSRRRATGRRRHGLPAHRERGQRPESARHAGALQYPPSRRPAVGAAGRLRSDRGAREAGGSVAESSHPEPFAPLRTGSAEEPYPRA